MGMHKPPHAESFGELMDVHGARDGAGNGSPLAAVAQSFAGVKRRAAIGKLDDHWRIQLSRSLQRGIHGVGARAVGRGQRKVMRFGVGKYLLYIVTHDDASRYELFQR